MQTDRSAPARRTWIHRVAAGLGLLVVGPLAACDTTAVASQAPYVQVCVVASTNLRVADALCQGTDRYRGSALDTAGYAFDYYQPIYTGKIPAIRQPVINLPIVHTVPPTTRTHVVVIDGGVPAAGSLAITVRSADIGTRNQTTELPMPTTSAEPATPTTSRG